MNSHLEIRVIGEDPRDCQAHGAVLHHGRVVHWDEGRVAALVADLGDAVVAVKHGRVVVDVRHVDLHVHRAALPVLGEAVVLGDNLGAGARR